jgi:hypothetical protein
LNFILEHGHTPPLPINIFINHVILHAERFQRGSAAVCAPHGSKLAGL